MLRFLVLVNLALLVLLDSANAQPARQNNQDNPPAEQINLGERFDKIELRIEELKQSNLSSVESGAANQKRFDDELRRRDQDFERLIGHFEILGIAFGFFGFVTIVIAVVQAIQSNSFNKREERRFAQQAGESQLLQNKLLAVVDLSAGVAQSAKEQTDHIFNSTYRKSNETLSLINNLLSVTESAAKRAAGAQRISLTQQRQTLTEQCVELIEKAKAEDDRGIVADTRHQAAVRVLSDQIQSLESQLRSYNSISAQEGPQRRGQTELELTAPCLFVRGVHHHLRNNFDEAIRYWKRSLEKSGSKNEKSGLGTTAYDANYWIGYEYNSLGNFNQAKEWFDKALASADQNRKVEVKRLLYESSFFDLGTSVVPDALVEHMVNEFHEIHPTVGEKTRASFATTIANIFLANAFRQGASELSSARHWYSEAIRLMPNAKWAHFGICQCNDYEGATPDHDRINDIILPFTINEYRTRQEFRTKVLARITEYICLIWLNHREKLDRIESNLDGDATRVHPEVTIYSQFRKQNVLQKEFWDEWQILYTHRSTRSIYDNMRIVQ